MTEKINDSQVSELREAIDKVVKAGPAFLSNKIPASKMAHTMINAVEDYAKQAKEKDTLHPKSHEAQELQNVLREIMGCGSGFLADRCDAACVARTVTYVVDEFSDKTSA